MISFAQDLPGFGFWPILSRSFNRLARVARSIRVRQCFQQGPAERPDIWQLRDACVIGLRQAQQVQSDTTDVEVLGPHRRSSEVEAMVRQLVAEQNAQLAEKNEQFEKRLARLER